MLLTNHGQQADTGDVAARVGVSAAAASRMLKNLARKKLVRLEPYKGAELTPEGMHRALRIVRRHRLLEVFLHTVMGFDLRESHERALLMQPTVDEVFEEKLDIMLNRPKVDPHGHPIPAKNVTWPRLADSPLLDLPAGTSGRISRVTSEDGEAIKVPRLPRPPSRRENRLGDHRPIRRPSHRPRGRTFDPPGEAPRFPDHVEKRPEQEDQPGFPISFRVLMGSDSLHIRRSRNQ